MIFTQNIGVTASLPHEVPPYLESTAHNWIYRGTSLWHDRQVVSDALPNISDLNTGQSVGLQLTLDGQLHIYINGRYRECGASGQPPQISVQISVLETNRAISSGRYPGLVSLCVCVCGVRVCCVVPFCILECLSTVQKLQYIRRLPFVDLHHHTPLNA